MKQTCETQSERQIEGLAEELRSHNPVTRVRARERLAAIGKPATPWLIELLKDTEQHVRWEAARTLIEIADPAATTALIAALNDEDEDVRWVAAEAVIALRDAAIRPLLSALIKRSTPVSIYPGAHHVFSGLSGVCGSPELLRVRDALKDEEPAAIVPVAAEAALRQLAR